MKMYKQYNRGWVLDVIYSYSSSKTRVYADASHQQSGSDQPLTQRSAVSELCESIYILIRGVDFSKRSSSSLTKNVERQSSKSMY